MIPEGRPFFKMSGSGNDFVMVDARIEPPGQLAEPDVIRTICARGTGVGADGIVFLETSRVAALRLTYLNADGSLAALCGNATLCTTRLAVELGSGTASGFTIETDSGVLAARLRDSTPEIDLQPVVELRPSVSEIQLASGERQMGFAVVGVPHLVVLVDQLESVDVRSRGSSLRRHASLEHGANVNFVAPTQAGGWRMRTYERGVEAETLACGSGAVAAAVLVTAWQLGAPDITVETRSGRSLHVRLAQSARGWLASLAGEARIIYAGRFAEI